MRTPKYHIYLTNEERSEVLKSLIDLKNSFIEQGRYTDVIDEIIIKLSCARKKNIKVKSYNNIYSSVFEVIGLKANEQAETFIDRYSSSFEEYLSSVVNKLRDTDSEYKDIEERIAKLYEDYPRVKAVFDLEQAAALSELDCKALLEVLTLRNRLFDKQQEAIYLRGCYDNIRYLNKAGIIQTD